MSNMDLKFGSVSSSPAGQQQQNTRGGDRDSPVVMRPGAMSGGANPPKNLGQNVSEMTFGDIEVKPEGSPSHDAKNASLARGNSFSGTATPNGGSPYRGNYDQRQHPRNSPSGYVKNNNGYYNQRGPKNGQQGYVQASPQMLSPYNIYQAAAAAVAGSPFFYGQHVPQYYHPSAAFNGVAPYSPQQQPSGGSSPKPLSGSVHQSPIQQHRATPKPHTTIKLSDPVTHQPIDLKTATNKTPGSSNASLSSSSPASTNSVASSIPKQETSSPSDTNASTAPKAGLDIRDQLKEQIRLRLEEEKKKKDQEAEIERKKQEEKERKEKEEQEIELAKKEKERLEKEAVEKAAQKEREAADKARLDKEKKEQDAATRLEEEKVKSEKAPGDTEEKVSAALASVNNQLKQGPSSLSNSQHAGESGEQHATRSHPAKNFATAFRPSVEELLALSYPSNIHKPKIASGTERFKYDNGFLSQFQSVVLFPPREDWESIRSTFETRGSGGGKGASRTPSKGIGAHGQQTMGSFGSGNSGFRDRSTSSGPGGFHNMGSGHGGKSLSRMNSSTNLVGRDSGNSRSGRQSSRRGKGNERSGSNRDHHEDHNTTMTGRNPVIIAAAAAAPLKKAENAWVPRVKAKLEEKQNEDEKDESGIKTTSDPAEISETVRMPPELVQRKVKSFLNKMTLENFDRILQRIMDVVKQSKYEKDGRTLRQIIELTFAKAVDEAHWSSMYAKFCFEMTNRVDPDIEDEKVEDRKGGLLFRKYLLSRCQEEFERGWTDKLPTNPDGSAVDPDLMSDEYYQAVVAKRRGLGLIRFIGELYILGLLSDKIINSCIIKLCIPKDPSEEVIESLCKLMSTVGRRLDANPQCKKFVDRYMERMAEIQQKPGLPSRLRFMLMDVRDLRNNRWKDKNAAKGPKTLQEIHDEAQKKEQENQRGDRGRSFMGRNDSKSNSFNMAGDLSKIGRIRSQGPGQPTLGPTSLNRDLSRSNGSHKSPSPGIPLSKEPSSSSLSSRTPSQNQQRANIFEHLNDEEENTKLESESQAEHEQA